MAIVKLNPSKQDIARREYLHLKWAEEARQFRRRGTAFVPYRKRLEFAKKTGWQGDALGRLR